MVLALREAAQSSIKNMVLDPGNLGSNPGSTPYYPRDLGQPHSFLIYKIGMTLPMVPT